MPAASRSDFGVNLPHGELVEAFALSFRANCLEPSRRWGEGVDVIVDAHNDCLGLSAAANQKTLVFLLDAAQDLPKLRAGSQSGNHIGRRGSLFFKDKILLIELINQFLFAV